MKLPDDRTRKKNQGHIIKVSMPRKNQDSVLESCSWTSPTRLVTGFFLTAILLHIASRAKDVPMLAAYRESLLLRLSCFQTPMPWVEVQIFGTTPTRWVRFLMRQEHIPLPTGVLWITFGHLHNIIIMFTLQKIHVAFLKHFCPQNLFSSK